MHCIGIAAAARVASLQRGRLPTRRLALTSRLLGFTRDFTAAAQSADNNAMCVWTFPHSSRRRSV